MRIIGVVDLRGGRAVHAHAGERERYVPVEHAAGARVYGGNALDLARIYVDGLGIDELYVADLDAILGGPVQQIPIRALAATGVPIWLDAGVRSLEAAQDALALGAARVVVGLETLPSFDALSTIADSIGSERLAFSLDLRAGIPIVMQGGDVAGNRPAEALAADAVACGAGALIVLDLARVGTGSGVDLEMLDRVRVSAPDVLLLAGGGVRSRDDLTQLAAVGCDGALVATALHTGRISVADVSAARQLAPRTAR